MQSLFNCFYSFFDCKYNRRLAAWEEVSNDNRACKILSRAEYSDFIPGNPGSLNLRTRPTSDAELVLLSEKEIHTLLMETRRRAKSKSRCSQQKISLHIFQPGLPPIPGYDYAYVIDYEIGTQRSDFIICLKADGTIQYLETSEYEDILFPSAASSREGSLQDALANTEVDPNLRNRSSSLGD